MQQNENGAEPLCPHILSSSMKDNTIIYNLQVLRDISLKRAIKYRWDPTIGSIYEDYLEILNDILKTA